jgi:SpoVK/Ycf46/Vps4 family AAA+-type ATPase
MGSVLKWMNDHTSDTVLLATANDVTKLPPELLRAGRFDCICYTDLTTDQARKKLWPYYLAQYGLDPKQKIPADANWTAAEIASCARQAALLDVPAAKAAEHIVPIAELHGEMIANLREYARKHGCIDANRGGKYVEDKARAAINSSSVNVSPPAARGRRVEGGGDPSLN